MSASARSDVVSLQRGECRWPIGDPANEAFRFCCAPVYDRRRVYCAEHAAASGKGAAVNNPDSMAKWVHGRDNRGPIYRV